VNGRQPIAKSEEATGEKAALIMGAAFLLWLEE
jgi:hypothetical protein